MAKFCFFAFITILSVHIALFVDPPQISPSLANKLTADSTPTISPSNPTASLAPAPANAPHGSISSSPSLPPLDAAPASSPFTLVSVLTCKHDVLTCLGKRVNWINMSC
ncbi:hypothetical protein CRG98_027430 [Punica granatum]|uniref:Pectinesterase inhibitor 10-like n=1 Tax=Punica granatum TaxID=22663 RepID=A0A2I0J7G8_PUNGR|nr:hypothetical protein CRG98_027430 [Punica granatum]